MSARALGLVPVLLASALVASAPAEAQAEAQAAPPPRSQPRTQQAPRPDIDPGVRPTLDRLREALAALATADRELMPAEGSSTLRGADEAALERRARARARISAGLDTLLAAGSRGRVAIKALATDWPGMDQVRRAEVRAAFLARDANDALQLVERMQVVAPRDTQFLRWRADALDSLARAAEALRTRQARFELAPEDEDGWRALLRAHEAAGSLARLRERLARLRIVYPDSRALREHEIEVLHRLGRRDEAARVMADTLGVSR